MGYPIGIDLGTTNSVVCVYRHGQVETIPVESRAIMPSAVSVLPNGEVLIGMQAKNRAMIDPENSVTSAKRYIGDGKTEWKIEGTIYTPIDVSRLVVKKLKESAEVFLGASVTEAVVTVPAYFSNNQKRDTRIAAEAAGLKVFQLMPEPTAAAISYGLDKGKDQTIMVYDLGGGTFDVSILKIQGNQFKVIAVDGDFYLGGDDFDLLLVEYLLEILQKKTKQDVGILRSLFQTKKKGQSQEKSPKELVLATQRLKEIAEKAKKDLSESDTAFVQIPNILGISLDEEISLKTYNRLITPLVDRTVTKMKAVLKSAKLGKSDIDRVILVGGSTRNRLVKERVAETIKEPFISERVDEVVAQGAGLVAGYLSSPEEERLPIEFCNVTPFSLGVCAFEEEGQSHVVNSIIISVNSPVPCVESKPYQLRTIANQDNKLEVYMLQGEERDPLKCLLVGKYVFSGITHEKEGKTIIDIEYGYDRDGIITTKAQQQSTGKMLSLTIEPIPEGSVWLKELEKSSTFDPSSLTLMVTPPGYDDIGKVLNSMKLSFQNYKKGQKLLCDIFFLNCGTSKHPSPKELYEYVSKGGCLYASDLTSSIVSKAFPDIFYFDGNIGEVEKMQAEVLDDDLCKALGKYITVEFDMGVWSVLNSVKKGVDVILRSGKTGKPLMVMASIGEGKVFYTCFHNHAQTSEAEKTLLQLLVMKQLSVVSGIPIEMVKKAFKK